jgi:hypothetical protein
MEAEAVKLVNEFGPAIGALLIVYLLTLQFLKLFKEKGKRIDDAMQRFVATLDANNKIIGNHLAHNTEAINNVGETNKNLEIAIHELMAVIRDKNVRP